MKILLILLCLVFAVAAGAAGYLYQGEVRKNELLRSENAKTSEEAAAEITKAKQEIKEELEKSREDKQKLLNQMNDLTKEKEAAEKNVAEMKKNVLSEREISLVTGADLETLRKEVASIRKEGNEGIKLLEAAYKRKQQAYEARILSLEASLAKVKAKVNTETDKYHYNLGVIYTQNKDYDSAVKEYKTALGYNPANAMAHYNLGIIYDDFYKDRENAKYHYRQYLELAPGSDDADAVKEWLADLDK